MSARSRKTSHFSATSSGTGTIPILSPRTPPSRCLPDRVAPACVAARRPQHSVRRGQDEPIRLGALQNHIGQREHIRRPLEQLIPNRAPRDRLPRRRQRRLPHTVMCRALISGCACDPGQPVRGPSWHACPCEWPTPTDRHVKDDRDADRVEGDVRDPLIGARTSEVPAVGVDGQQHARALRPAARCRRA